MKNRKIYTSYFGGLKKLPNTITPISICGKPIPGWTGLEFKKLAPSWSIYKEYKESFDQERYIRRYQAEILGKLNPQEILGEILNLSEGDIALVCYEKPGDFCHRHLVASWLPYEITEYNYENT